MYASNKPMSSIDPSGLCWWDDLSDGQRLGLVSGGIGLGIGIGIATAPFWLPLVTPELLIGIGGFGVGYFGPPGFSGQFAQDLGTLLNQAVQGFPNGPGGGFGGGDGGCGGGGGGTSTSNGLGGPGNAGGSGTSQIVGSFDPNDKLAPAGYGDAAFVQADGSLAYTIRFENKSDATAPARQIVVTDTLDANLNLDTFELTDITFANQTILTRPGLNHYETTVPMTANGTSILVDVQASLDRETREVTLTLRAIDQTTGWFPEDPLVGLLYPNDDTGRGEGSISYVVKPKAGMPSGTVIENRASIVFDYNDPIDTPLVHNTLDAAAPTSEVASLPSTTTSPTFAVSWSGQDEANGSGVAGYDLFVSQDGSDSSRS